MIRGQKLTIGSFNMPIFAKETVEIPTEDIVTWVFSGPSYDPNRPVSGILFFRLFIET